MATTIQLKRATAARWAELNYVLAAGEPGYVTDAVDKRFCLKIGDGKTAWNDLPFVGGGEGEISADIEVGAEDQLPSIGMSGVTYYVRDTKTIKRWNSGTQSYDVYGGTGTGNSFDDIQMIIGGDANGN